MQTNYFVCFGIGIAQENLAKTSKKFGNFNIIIEHEKKKIKKNKKLIDFTIPGSVYNFQKVNSFIKKIKKNYKNINDLIFRSSGPAILTAFHICKGFKIKRIKKDLAYSIYSKNYFLKFLIKKNILNKDKLFNYNHLKNNNNNLNFVIKPDAPIIGKKGVFKTNHLEKNKIKKISSLSDNKKINITENVNGQDISVVMFKRKNKKNFNLINFIIEQNFFSNKGTLHNKGIAAFKNLKDKIMQKKIIIITNKIIKNYDDYYGFLVISFRVNIKEIFPYEINIGLVGDNYAEKLFPFFYNNNIYETEILNLMGQRCDFIEKKKYNFVGLSNKKYFFSESKFNKYILR